MASPLGFQPQTLLQSILDNVGVAIAVIDRERRFVFTNQAALELFGAAQNLSVAEWRTHFKFHDSQGNEIPVGEAPIIRAFAGEEVEPHEIRVTSEDGRFKWLHVAGHPFSVLGLTGVLVIVTDETKQIELRKSLERAQHLEAVGILAGGLAHDFNNVLSAISGYVSLALNDEGLQEIGRVRLQQMAASLRKGSALVARLMEFSRPHENQISSVQINDVVNAAMELARPLIKTGVQVKTELSESLPAVQADPLRLEQVFVNLILNSLDAMPQGGALTLGTGLVRQHDVSRTNEEGKQFVLINVADTGIGIPDDIKRSIFDPFFTTKREGKGVGLGLSSALEIVRQYKGHIDLQSTPGAGTRFTVYLPVT